MKNLKQQRGVILPLMAVICLAMLGAAIFLALDIMSVKGEQLRFKAAVEAVCRRVAPLSIIQRKAYDEFTQRIGELTNMTGSTSVTPYLKSTKIISARLLIPTMPANGSFNRFTRSGYLSVGSGSAAPVVPSMTHLAPFNTNCPVCSFISDISTPAKSLSGNDSEMGHFSLFPFDVLANNQGNTEEGNYSYNVGMTVGCEVIGEIRSPFSFFIGGTTNEGESLTQSKVKTLWWLPVRSLLKPAAGLTIGIAPEMNTSVNEPRFRFVGQSIGGSITADDPDNGLYDSQFQEKYDPLRRIMNTEKHNEYFQRGGSSSSSSSSSSSFSYHSGTASSIGFVIEEEEVAPVSTAANTWDIDGSVSSDNNSSVSSTPASDDDDDTTFEPPSSIMADITPEFGANSSSRSPACTSTTCNELPDTGVVYGSILEDALTACTNPAILTRNLMVSTIVELASRHGQLRDSTEVSIINPVAHSANVPGTPSLISHIGDDIAVQRYQMPYVLSDQVFTGDSSPNWGNPFGSTLPGASAIVKAGKEHQKLFASQMRMCYHIYDQPTPDESLLSSTGAILRFQESRLQDELENDGFEPSLYRTTLVSPLKELGEGEAPNPSDPWDQPYPWTSASDASLTLGQITSTIGSIQMCPVEANCPASTCAIEKKICSKSTSATLTPDLAAFFKYISQAPLSDGEKVLAETGNSAVPSFHPAIKQPGIFSLADGINNTTQYPLDISSYLKTFNTNSHVLLVLHTLPSSAQLSVVKDIVTEMATGKKEADGSLSPAPVRPVTVIYIPTTASGASTSSIALLQDAITPRATSNTGTPLTVIEEPSLFVVAPRADMGTLNDADFQIYWHKMLTNDDEGAIALAQSIFYGRLMRLELRY